MAIEKTKMRTLLHLRTPTTAEYILLETPVHLIWCSIGGTGILHSDLQRLLEKCMRLPHNDLNTYLHSSTRWIVLEHPYSALENTTKGISTGDIAMVVN